MFDGKGVHVVMTSSAAIILLIRPSKLNRSNARATAPLEEVTVAPQSRFGATAGSARPQND